MEISKEEAIFANEARRLRCAIAAMDAEAEVAMAEFKAAAALQRDETPPAKERRPLQRRCEDACFRWNALCYAMIVCPAQSKRRLLAQIRELGRAAMIGGILHGNGSQGRGVSIRCGGPGLAWEVGERGSNSRARLTRISVVTKMCCGDALDASGLWPDCGGPRAELQSTMVALHIFAIWLLLDALIVVAVL